jgi:hypothetical protein
VTVARGGQLLHLAELILAGSVRMPRGRGARVAALLARTALEDIVTDLCAAQGVDVAKARMRVRLSCLIALDPPVAGEAAMAWWGLSRACHQHAFEIAPHHAEVSHLVHGVRTLAATTRSGSGEPPPAAPGH